MLKQTIEEKFREISKNIQEFQHTTQLCKVFLKCHFNIQTKLDSDISTDYMLYNICCDQATQS